VFLHFFYLKHGNLKESTASLYERKGPMDFAIGGAVSLLLLGYLIFVMFNPEKF
jgi:K+-transporting ATPase KdpF subunit